MLHLWIIKICLAVSYYFCTLVYPLMETCKALGLKKKRRAWTRVLTYWLVYVLISRVDIMFSTFSTYVVGVE